MDNFDLRKYLVENKVTTNSRMLTEAAEVPAWLKGKLEDVHVKPGQGSIFALKEAQGYTAKGKEMELILNNFPSVSIDVDIENGVVTKVNGDIEKESIYSYDENNFAAALKPFKDAGVKVDYTPWTSSGGDDYEGYFNIDASSLNNAIASKKITIKSDLEDPEEYLVLAEGITFQDLENAGVDRVDLTKLEKFKNLISSLPVDQVIGFISNELKKDPAFHNNLMKKLNPSGKSTLGPMGDEDNWASAEYYKDR